MDRERSKGWAARVVTRHARTPRARRIVRTRQTAAALAALLLLPPLQAARGAGAPEGEADVAQATSPAQPPMKSVDAHGGTVTLPPLRPVLDEAAKAAARAAVADARAAAAVANPAGTALAYALASDRLRTPTESAKVLAALRAEVAQVAPRRGLHVDTMRAGEHWRAVCWPISRREDADHLRQLLAQRGLPLEIIAF
jgi:hypothetical protein